MPRHPEEEYDFCGTKPIRTPTRRSSGEKKKYHSKIENQESKAQKY